MHYQEGEFEEEAVDAAPRPLMAGAPPRRLQSSPAALAVKLLNVSLSDIAVHYYEAHRFLQSATQQVAAAFGVPAEKVIPLQLRPDERLPTRHTVFTFTVRGRAAHDLLGQMREMFDNAETPLGEWRAAYIQPSKEAAQVLPVRARPLQLFFLFVRQVAFEPLRLGAPGVVKDVPSPKPLSFWQRPGVEASWPQAAALTLKLAGVDLMHELKTDRQAFEDRLARQRDFAVSAGKLENANSFRVARFAATPGGTLVELAPALHAECRPTTPHTEAHLEQLRRWAHAFEGRGLMMQAAADSLAVVGPEAGKGRSSRQQHAADGGGGGRAGEDEEQQALIDKVGGLLLAGGVAGGCLAALRLLPQTEEGPPGRFLRIGEVTLPPQQAASSAAPISQAAALRCPPNQQQQHQQQQLQRQQQQQMKLLLGAAARSRFGELAGPLRAEHLKISFLASAAPAFSCCRQQQTERRTRAADVRLLKEGKALLSAAQAVGSSGASAKAQLLAGPAE
ncbi:hypothetical protein Efla_007772 [Eimeria flavescens]